MIDYHLVDHIKALDITKEQFANLSKGVFEIQKEISDHPIHIQYRFNFRYYRLLASVLASDQISQLKERLIPEPMYSELKLKLREKRRKDWLNFKDQYSFLNRTDNQWQPFLNARELAISKTSTAKRAVKSDSVSCNLKSK